MRTILVHNPAAGGARGPTLDEILAAVEALGWRADVAPRADFDLALCGRGAAVLVAGGDGTVGRVAKRLAGTCTPLGVIPTGTVNNVARTLGIGVDARTAIESLPRAVVRDVDLGLVHNGAGPVEWFLEGFGVGLLAWVMAERVRRKHKQLRRAFELLAGELEAYEARPMRIEIDGKRMSGEYLIASVMNLRSLGPALGLAPDALWNDGRLDVVLVRPEHRNALLAHLRRAALQGEVPLPHFEVHKARRVRVGVPDRWAHVDDASRELAGDVEVRVDPGAVKFFVPPTPSRQKP